MVALVINAVIAFMNGLSCHMLIRCKEAVADTAAPAEITSLYSKIAYAGLGSVGVYITDMSIIITLVGVCVTYQITFAQLLLAVPGNPFTSVELTVLSALAIYPLSCAKDVSFLSSVSLLGTPDIMF